MCCHNNELFLEFWEVGVFGNVVIYFLIWQYSGVLINVQGHSEIVTSTPHGGFILWSFCLFA